MSGIKTVFITGPTASGKTALSVRLAKKFGGEIVSADSMQIYRGIHIASAAPDEEEKCGVPHHMLEFLEPESEFSVADYTKAARKIIKDINSRGRLPIVVGGTGLYINALADNTAFITEKADGMLRDRLEKRFDSIGGMAMLKELEAIDPVSAAKLHPNDRKRIVRALEVYSLTGETKTRQNELSKTGEKIINPLFIGITYKDRQRLYDRINLRVDKMLENGLLNEAEAALNRSGGGAFQAIGHKELAGYINGECTLDEAAKRLKMQTRRYAKRQLTWFNKNERIHWLYPDGNADIFAAAAALINKFLSEED